MDNLKRQAEQKQDAIQKSQVTPALRRKINKMLEEASFAFDSTYNEPDADQGRIHKLRNRARTLAQKALQKQADNIDALNLLGRIALDEGDLNSAGQFLDSALEIAPESASLSYSRGHIYLATQAYEQAEHLFLRAEQLAPKTTRAKASLAYTRTKRGAFVEAFADYRELIKLDPSDPHIKTKLFECIRYIQADYYSPELERELIGYFKFNDVDHRDLSNLAASLLAHKYDLINGSSPLDPQQLSNDELLNLALRRCQFQNPIIEEFLTACRQCILQEAIDQQKIDSRFMEFLVSISLQCIQNEFVYAVSLTEEKVLRELQSMVSTTVLSRNWQTIDVEYPLLLLSMYSLLHHNSFRDHLLRKPLSAWSSEVQPVIEPHLYEPQKEKEIERNIEVLTPVQSSMSQSVGQQYEENPYPRWTTLSYATPTDYGQALAAELQGFTPPSFLHNQTIKVLIAGCGTGKHAIQVAKHFRNVEVTAIYLSRASLAYATKQARLLGVNNIEFFQADILELQPRQQYHIIESSGVLHHMAEPMEGWQALTRLLVQGGLMKVGLYSERARRIVTHARQVIAENQLSADDEHIRIFRQAVLDGLVSGDFDPIKQSSDFYNLSGCRDLLFHVQEHLFSPLALQACIDSVGLTFLGFVNLPFDVKQAYDKHFASDPRRINLENWDSLEEAAPDIFGSMFQFYCQKQSDNITRLG
jgi:ubiquinone/menaquinone biosynthesis C-methylase UbiE/tetratricopeptide (TPR) repeat protein